MRKNGHRILYYFLGVFLLSLLIGGGLFLSSDSNLHFQLNELNFAKGKQIHKQKIHSQNIDLVSIGDSLTYGQQDPTKRGGYVYLIKQKLQHNYDVKVSTHNYGKTGDRTDQIQQRIENDPTMQKQISEADVITMTFGGNDLMQVLQSNFQRLFTNSLSEVMPQKELNYQQKIESLMREVRYLNPVAPIFVISIYNPFYVYFPTVTDLQKYTNSWVELTQKTLTKYSRVYFVDVNQRLSQGQYLGKNQADLRKQSQMNLEHLSSQEVEEELKSYREKNDYLSSNDHFHPNLKGYRYMTNQLYRVMIDHHATWLNSETTKR